MRKLFYILLVMLLGVGCEADFACNDIQDPSSSPSDPSEGTDPGNNPTQPIKKRPIVPSGKIQRPRFSVLTLNNEVCISPEACSATPMTLTVRCEATGFEHSVVVISPEDIMQIPFEELRGEVAIITEVANSVEVEYFILSE